jgi:flavin reductase (DIM6/NTAB) family NADH-FMN oxidoreductase RutF
MTKRALDLRQAHRLLSPGPVTLLSSQYRGQPNLMAVAWAAPISLDPPLVGVAIHPTRLTHEFVSKSEQFALNVPHLEIITATHRCGMFSGRDSDKFVAAGLTMEPATEIEPPLVSECVGHLECGVIERVRLGDHDFFVGQVLALSAEEEAFDGFWKTDEEGGHILHHLGADRYAALAKSYRAS